MHEKKGRFRHFFLLVVYFRYKYLYLLQIKPFYNAKKWICFVIEVYICTPAQVPYLILYLYLSSIPLFLIFSSINAGLVTDESPPLIMLWDCGQIGPPKRISSAFASMQKQERWEAVYHFVSFICFRVELIGTSWKAFLYWTSWI